MRALLGAVALALSLTACGSSATSDDSGGSSEPKKDQELQESSITLKDGRKITCVVYKDEYYEQGGLSCDWASAPKR